MLIFIEDTILSPYTSGEYPFPIIIDKRKMKIKLSLTIVTPSISATFSCFLHNADNFDERLHNFLFQVIDRYLIDG